MARKWAQTDIVTGALTGGGFETTPPVDTALYHYVEVPENFDIENLKQKWDGVAWQTFTPAVVPTPDGRAFHRLLPGLFDGTTSADKLARGIAVLKAVNIAAGSIGTDFRAASDVTPLSTARQAYLKALWIDIKGVVGGLSPTEITAIETAAVSSGFSLV